MRLLCILTAVYAALLASALPTPLPLPNSNHAAAVESHTPLVLPRDDAAAISPRSFAGTILRGLSRSRTPKPPPIITPPAPGGIFLAAWKVPGAKGLDRSLAFKKPTPKPGPLARFNPFKRKNG